MRIYLAPMEGLADHFLRRIITGSGGYDLAFTEFVRVVDHLLPDSVFLNRAPELNNSGRTGADTPVRVQLLGNHEQAMAQNAVRAIELGSCGVDINFGCPSKTVNNSQGGAVLLKDPQTLFNIISSVRKALPAATTLSAKMRLGYDSDSHAYECASALRDGGADEITVHARTRIQGYQPPAFWHLVAGFEERLEVPITINGEIWNRDDAAQAILQARCSNLMLGRGSVRNPLLARQIRESHAAVHGDWQTTKQWVQQFWSDIRQSMTPRYCGGRLKQWLFHLKEEHEEAALLFESIRRIQMVEEIDKVISRM